MRYLVRDEADDLFISDAATREGAIEDMINNCESWSEERDRLSPPYNFRVYRLGNPVHFQTVNAERVIMLTTVEQTL